MTEYVFDTKHDRYPVAVHVILTDGGWIVGSADGDGRVLLMRRAGSGYADGLLGLPAGHVDLGKFPPTARFGRSTRNSASSSTRTS
jgi:8-oxo-dGTP diphosphatase